jgi:hypothetical protein
MQLWLMDVVEKRGELLYLLLELEMLKLLLLKLRLKGCLRGQQRIGDEHGLCLLLSFLRLV